MASRLIKSVYKDELGKKNHGNIEKEFPSAWYQEGPHRVFHSSAVYTYLMCKSEIESNKARQFRRFPNPELKVNTCTFNPFASL